MAEQHVLDARQARVLGVLIEKAFTTPEQYPLSLNAAVVGSNQKSNRDPVLELEQSEVLTALQKLILAGLVGASHGAGSRVEKYRHNAQAALEVDDAQAAVLAELLLRGPQSPGELRGRASRMVALDSLEALAAVVEPLIARGLVARLPPSPGSRSERLLELLSSERAAGTPGAAHAPVHAQAHAQVRATPQPSTHAPAQHAKPIVHSVPGFERASGPDEGGDPSLSADARLAARVEELEHDLGRLRRQLSHLAWQLGRKLEG